jgi:hypothetical protein
MRTLSLGILMTWLLLPLLGSRAICQEQDERRNQIGSPGLILNSERPLARINVLEKFGTRIYMAGLDHCVRSYEIDEQLKIDWATGRTYRWPAWREERGEILALTINQDGTKLAIGGIGLMPGLVAEFDVESTKLLRSRAVVLNNVTALDYNSTGTLGIGSAYGEVAYWTTTDEFNLLRKATSATDFVRDVHCDNQQVFSVHASGELAEFGIFNNEQARRNLQSPNSFIISAAFSEDGTRVLLGRRHSDLRGEFAEFSRINQQRSFSWRSPTPWFIEGVRYADNQQDLIAFGSDNVQIVTNKVRYQSTVRTRTTGSNMVTETKVADAKLATLLPLPSQKFVFALAESNELRGLDQGVEIFRSSVNQSDINSISWEKDQRGFVWTRGDQKRSFQFDSRHINSNFQNDAIYRHQEIFKVNADLATPSLASIPMSDRTSRPIPLQLGRDGEVTSHLTFEKDGKRLLAIGHRFGVTLFEFDKSNSLKLVRKLVGHQQVVTAMAVSEDRKLLLTAARDGTICCFSLEPWKFQPELGASFSLQNNEIVIDELDDGSPLWETGLSRGDRIQGVQYEGQDVSVPDALNRLGNFEVGRQFKFISANLTSVVSTRVLQRPIWKFVHAQNEWILYRWRDFTYDCSLQGDQLVSWLINPNLESAPILLNAENARDRFYNPNKLKDLLSLDNLRSERIQVPELIPPKVNMELMEQGDQIVIKATLQADDNALLVGEPQELSVWLGDMRVGIWKSPDVPTTETITIDRQLLRQGKNRVIARAYNQFGIRGDSDFREIEHVTEKSEPSLFGVVLGIKDYNAAHTPVDASRGGLTIRDLEWTVNDAISLEKALKNQASQYPKSDIQLLLNDQVTRESISAQFERIRKTCRADDILVLTFAGHGHQWEEAQENQTRSTFMLLTAETDMQSKQAAVATSLPIANPFQENQGVEFSSLFDQLASLPCRKVIIMDACHSGGAIEMVRSLTPDFVVGPTVLTAAGKNQFAIEVPSKMHGIFTAAILEALDAKFEQADTDHDNKLTPAELHRYCAQRVPQIFENSEHFMLPEDFKLGQDPEFWGPEADINIPLFSRSR